MNDYQLTDSERHALLSAAFAEAMLIEPPYRQDLLNAIAKIAGVDTVVTAHRAYPPRPVRPVRWANV